MIVIGLPMTSAAVVAEYPRSAPVPREDMPFERLAYDRVVGGFDDSREKRQLKRRVAQLRSRRG